MYKHILYFLIWNFKGLKCQHHDDAIGIYNHIDIQFNISGIKLINFIQIQTTGCKNQLKQLFYATDRAGESGKVNSVGWEPENIAMQQAWEEVNTKIEDARKRMQAGEVSPILYYMEKTIMDLPLLASYVNNFQWQVKRHLKPSVFRKLNDDTLRKYAAAFKISLEELKKAGQ